MKNKTKLIFAVSVLGLIAIVFFLNNGVKILSSKKTPNDINDFASTTEKISGGVSYTGSGDFKIEQVPIEQPEISFKMPNLNRPVVYPENMSPEARGIIYSKINENVSKLKTDPNISSEWLALGINRKILGDYEGARDAWEYALALNPKDPVTLSNLGDLYGYHLKDVVKAEKNFIKSMEVGRLLPNYYLRASDFYRDVVGDLEKAKKVLEDGLRVIADEENMKQALEQINELIKEKSTAPKPL